MPSERCKYQFPKTERPDCLAASFIIFLATRVKSLLADPGDLIVQSSCKKSRITGILHTDKSSGVAQTRMIIQYPGAWV